MSIRTAALVLANRYPAGISALSTFFDAAEADVFVHVDAKTDDAPFRDAARCASRAVHFVADRVSVFWRGFTMVEATIGLLNAARAEGGYDRYLIVSDDSLPVVHPDKLRESLRPEFDYIAAGVATSDLRLRYDRFFMFDCLATQVRWIPVVDREVTEDALRRFARLALLREGGKKSLSIYCHGSQWMGLTSASVDRILASWENDIWLRDSFEFSEVPDEGYFHTILSEHGVPAWRPLTYVDWSVPTPPRVFKTLAELSEVDFKGALFVRKIDFTPTDLAAWTAIIVGTR